MVLFRLLVQFHVRHQDVLLSLLAGVGIGATVARALVGALRPHASPAVQVDDPHDQHQQNQPCYHDQNQGGQVIALR